MRPSTDHRDFKAKKTNMEKEIEKLLQALPINTYKPNIKITHFLN